MEFRILHEFETQFKIRADGAFELFLNPIMTSVHLSGIQKIILAFS